MLMILLYTYKAINTYEYLLQYNRIKYVKHIVADK